MFNFKPQNKESEQINILPEQKELFPKEKFVPDYKWKIDLKNSGIINLQNSIIETNSFITNNRNLPDLLFRRLCKKDYFDPTGAFITGSSLSLNPKQFFFKNQYKYAQITDANELVASMLGTAVHNHMEDIRESDDEIIEKRLTTTICGELLSAQLDHFTISSGILSDYKVTKAWQKKYRKVKMEEGSYEKDPYVLQSNFIAYLLRQNGYTVNKARLIFIYKDYDEYIYKADYPFAQSEEEWIPIWDDAKVEAILNQRVTALKNIDIDSIQLTLCSDKEMWRTPTQYALKKVGSSRALPNTSCDSIELIDKKLKARLKKYKSENVVPHEWYDYTEEEKIKYAESTKNNLYVTIKQNEPTYCMSYCPGRHYCMQYQEWYRGNKKYKVKVINGDKEKVIEMYGSDFLDACEKTKMIHSTDCIVEHPKAIHDLNERFFGDLKLG